MPSPIPEHPARADSARRAALGQKKNSKVLGTNRVTYSRYSGYAVTLLASFFS
jgi:hypothetical protein